MGVPVRKRVKTYARGSPIVEFLEPGRPSLISKETKSFSRQLTEEEKAERVWKGLDQVKLVLRMSMMKQICCESFSGMVWHSFLDLPARVKRRKHSGRV